MVRTSSTPATIPAISSNFLKASAFPGPGDQGHELPGGGVPATQVVDPTRWGDQHTRGSGRSWVDRGGHTRRLDLLRQLDGAVVAHATTDGWYSPSSNRERKSGSIRPRKVIPMSAYAAIPDVEPRRP